MVTVPKIRQARVKRVVRRRIRRPRSFAIAGSILLLALFGYVFVTQSDFLTGPQREARFRLNQACPRDTNCYCYSAFLLKKLTDDEVTAYLANNTMPDSAAEKLAESKAQCFNRGFDKNR